MEGMVGFLLFGRRESFFGCEDLAGWVEGAMVGLALGEDSEGELSNKDKDIKLILRFALLVGKWGSFTTFDELV